MYIIIIRISVFFCIHESVIFNKVKITRKCDFYIYKRNDMSTVKLEDAIAKKTQSECDGNENVVLSYTGSDGKKQISSVPVSYLYKEDSGTNKGVSLEWDSENNKFNISESEASSCTPINLASDSKDGLMSKSDKSKLDKMSGDDVSIDSLINDGDRLDNKTYTNTYFICYCTAGDSQYPDVEVGTRLLSTSYITNSIDTLRKRTLSYNVVIKEQSKFGNGSDDALQIQEPHDGSMSYALNTVIFDKTMAIYDNKNNEGAKSVFVNSLTYNFLGYNNITKIGMVGNGPNTYYHTSSIQFVLNSYNEVGFILGGMNNNYSHDQNYIFIGIHNGKCGFYNVTYNIVEGENYGTFKIEDTTL